MCSKIIIKRKLLKFFLCTCMCKVCVHVYVCICMCVKVHMHGCAHECGDQKLMLGILLEHTPPYILRQSFPNLKHTDLSSASRELALRCLSLPLECWGKCPVSHSPGFYVGVGLHACIASSLPAEPSPQPPGNLKKSKRNKNKVHIIILGISSGEYHSKILEQVRNILKQNIWNKYEKHTSCLWKHCSRGTRNTIYTTYVIRL